MRRRVLGGSAAAVAMGLGLLLSGCGSEPGPSGVASAGGPNGSTVSPTATASLSNYEKAVKFAQCMRAHGVDMPDPEPGGGGRIRLGGPGTDPAKTQAALEACRQFSPVGDGSGRVDPQAAERMRKFAQCMRENGVAEFPDPEPGGGIRIDAKVGQDPDLPAAQRECERRYPPRPAPEPSR